MLNLVVSVATPLLTVPVPKDVDPCRNSTVPVAVVLEIVAVSVTLAPVVTELAEAVSVTVLVVVPASGSQKPAQPEIANIGAVNTARRKSFLIPLRKIFDLILCTVPGARNQTS